MRIETTEIVAVEFGGSVMMYGRESVFLENQEETFLVVHTRGADGYASEVKESVTDKAHFDKLLKSLSELDIEVMVEDEDDEETCDYTVNEHSDGDGASEWFLNVFYPNDRYVSFIGYDYKSDSFVKISNMLKKCISKFGKIKNFFDGLTS